MTRKDYILIAKAITNTQERIKASTFGPIGDNGKAYPVDKEEQLRGVRRVAAHLADALAADNPNFDAARFLKACGYGGTEEQRRAGNGFSAASVRPEQPTALNLSALQRAYDEGRASFASGAPCPYSIATPEHAQFMSGRHAALVEHERATKVTATR